MLKFSKNPDCSEESEEKNLFVHIEVCLTGSFYFWAVWLSYHRESDLTMELISLCLTERCIVSLRLGPSNALTPRPIIILLRIKTLFRIFQDLFPRDKFNVGELSTCIHKYMTNF